MTEKIYTNRIETALHSGLPFIVLDGGLATELEKRGFDLRNSLWSASLLASKPEVIRDVHLDYLNAGAECIITASYQATVPGFMKKGFSRQESEKLMGLSVSLAREAVSIYQDTGASGFSPLVAGSAGSYGAYLADGSEYRGDYFLSDSEYRDFHRQRVEILAGAGADIIAFETFPRLDEAAAAAEVMEEFPGMPYWIVFTAVDERCISSGGLFADAASVLGTRPGLAGVGINCSPPDLVLPLLESVSDNESTDFVVYPNSGEQFCTEDRSWNEEGRSSISGSLVRSWCGAGARFIGGCCRTGPDDIRRIREIRDSMIKG